MPSQPPMMPTPPRPTGPPPSGGSIPSGGKELFIFLKILDYEL